MPGFPLILERIDLGMFLTEQHEHYLAYEHHVYIQYVYINTTYISSLDDSPISSHSSICYVK